MSDATGEKARGSGPHGWAEHLDTLDRKILFELDCNSRQSFSSLARRVRQGRDRVEYRVQRLVERGIIRAFSTTLNVYKLGLTIYKTYFRLRNDKRRIKELYNYLYNQPHVYRVAVYAGHWDLNVAMVARTPREFYDHHSALMAKFHEIIVEYAMYTLIDVWRFRKGYFIGQQTPGLLTGGLPGSVKLDPLEYEILKLLASNARLTAIELAERIGTTPAVVKYRLKQLEAGGVILGYRLDVDHEKLGMLYFKTQLFLSSYQQKLVTKLRDFAEKTPSVTYFISQLGECPVEMELEVSGLTEYHEVLDSLRQTFPAAVDNLRSMLIHREFFKWVPAQLAVLDQS